MNTAQIYGNLRLIMNLPKIIDHIKGAWENKSTEHTYMRILRRGTPTTEY